MGVRTIQITVDCAGSAGVGPRLFFQQVPEGTTAKNRMQVDVRAAPGLEPEPRMAAPETECARLISLGGTRISAGFIVMADPEGNEFCLD